MLTQKHTEVVVVEIDQQDYIAQAKEVMQQQKDAGTRSKVAAGLIEALTQKLLALDNVHVDGDQEVRQKRKTEINRINQLCDSLETHRTK